MRLQELLLEKPVLSSWITDLTYNRPNRTLTMRLNNGKAYSIPGLTRSMFERWTRSPSKGKFFHDHINGGYLITRVK